jgi:hypothetical protein
MLSGEFLFDFCKLELPLQEHLFLPAMEVPKLDLAREKVIEIFSI